LSPDRKRTLKRLCLVVVSLFAFTGLSGTAQAAKKPKPVSVYPAPGTPVASDKTTISFRGLKPKHLGRIKVVGAKSGVHGGKRVRHSDGRGVSFNPRRKFVRGELVRVYTGKRIKRARNGDFRFRIGRFYGSDDRKGGPGTPPTTDGLRSRPDLKPPVLKVEKTTDQAAPGKLFLAPKEDGLTIADNFGRISWFRPTGFGGTGESVYNFQAQEYRGKPVLTYWKGASTSTGFSQIGTFEILNRKYNRIARFQPKNGYRADIHEFDISPRNTALVLSYRGVYWNTSSVGGPKKAKVLDNVVQEIDIKTGAVMFEWHSLGNVGLKASAGEQPDDGSPWDYFHANSIKMDGDSYLVSGRRPSAIYRIDRDTARIRWILRGDGGPSGFKMGPGTSFAYQHDAVRLPNGNISLFDNGSGRGVPTINEESSGMILKLTGNSKKTRKATLVKRFNHPAGIVSGSQGNMDVQENGNALVGWGSVSQATEFNPQGDVVLDISFADAPVSSYRAYKSPWQGIPKRRPAIASEATATGATVWASWNGAQHIDRWRVLTGPNAGSLEPVASSPWRGLETEIPMGTPGARIAVEAIDADGKVLKRSAVVPVGVQKR
jgi:hypothetical protein